MIALLRELSMTFNVPVRYCGWIEKEQYVAKKASGDPVTMQALTFAICSDGKLRDSYGANQNALYLDQCGHPVMVASDDALCRTHLRAEAKSGLVFVMLLQLTTSSTTFSRTEVTSHRLSSRMRTSGPPTSSGWGDPSSGLQRVQELELSSGYNRELWVMLAALVPTGWR